LAGALVVLELIDAAATAADDEVEIKVTIDAKQ
jgi:hypothetical protein